MDIQLIYGPNDSGKSKYAEEVAVKSGSKLVYLATMVPQNEDNYKRIEKHRIQRQDKGFCTVEAAWNIEEIPVDGDTVVLLEDASNLLANGIFSYDADGSVALQKILCLAKRCKKLIIVSISGLSAEGYDAETADYIKQLNQLNEELKAYAGSCVNMECKQDSGKHYSYFCNRECEYFPCHKSIDLDNFNCLFCYCPLFALGKECGGNFEYTQNGYKDCSKCLIPHRKDNYERIIERSKKIAEKVKQ